MRDLAKTYCSNSTILNRISALSRCVAQEHSGQLPPSQLWDEGHAGQSCLLGTPLMETSGHIYSSLVSAQHSPGGSRHSPLSVGVLALLMRMSSRYTTTDGMPWRRVVQCAGIFPELRRCHTVICCKETVLSEYL